MKQFLIIALLILTACSSQSEPQKINAADSIQSCMVYSDKYECLFTNGNTYYVSVLKLAQITKYDKSAWKENVVYCPKDLPLANITNTSLQCNTNKICKNPNTNILEIC